MKLEEVLPALREGKKIRRRTWCKDTYIYINSYGNFETQSGRPFEIILDGYDLRHNNWEIVKEKKKVKLRDLTEEQYNKWIKNNCTKYSNYCNGCPFQKVRCDNDENKNDVWIENKELYSDKFLDQEIEIEED